MDKSIMQRSLPVASESVSVDLKQCRATLGSSSSTGKFALLQAVELAFNSLGVAGATPLIVDSGASCCVSPHREDFVTYSTSDVKIKDLSGVNKVAGEGMIEWCVLDKFGREYTISIKCYHVPTASVRLLSPQCLYQSKELRGSAGGQDDKQYVIRLNDGTVLLAPYGPANLPLLQLSDPTNPSCLWSKCFSVQGISPEMWSMNVLAANNINLTAAQKELMRWHHRLSHAGLSTIHNLCRQKRTTPVKAADDLQPIRTKPILPCTFNVPACSCEGLFCAACETSKATRRAPTVKPTIKPPDKQMVLKQGDLKPGVCMSCDHFISPVKGRVIASSGYSSSSDGYTCGTLYVDHASGYIFLHNQKTTSAGETIRGKLLLEREAAESGVAISRYHSDNGTFSSDEFQKHCQALKQKISLSGVGAKFQNGVAERSIGTTCNMARANMLHATMR
jgi:hypothetical protein